MERTVPADVPKDETCETECTDREKKAEREMGDGRQDPDKGGNNENDGQKATGPAQPVSLSLELLFGHTVCAVLPCVNASNLVIGERTLTCGGLQRSSERESNTQANRGERCEPMTNNRVWTAHVKPTGDDAGCVSYCSPT